MLTSFEFWTSIIALCTVGVIYLGFDVIQDASRKNAVEATWGNHLLVGPVCLYAALLAVGALLKVMG